MSEQGKRAIAATITGGGIRVETSRDIYNAMAQDGDEGPLISHWFVTPCGPYLDDGRNKAVEAFLKMDGDVLLFIDSDISFTRDDVRYVVDACTPENPVVGGAYFSPMYEKFFCVAYDLNDEKELISLKVSEVLDMEGLRPCDAIGTGFMAIHRSLLEMMPEYFGYPQPWFAELVVNETHLGEDMTFCLRVGSLGFKPQLVCDAKVTHYKTVGLAWSSLRGIPLSEVE